MFALIYVDVVLGVVWVYILVRWNVSNITCTKRCGMTLRENLDLQFDIFFEFVIISKE